MVVVAIISLATVLGTATLLVRSRSSVGDENGDADRHVVRRGSFDITVPASGELAALKQIEIRNRLEYRSAIIEIVDEGSMVKEGDVLYRLAEDELDDKIQDARDQLNSAKNAESPTENCIR